MCIRDRIRKKYNDWDFSPEGRERQSKRMRELSDKLINDGNNVIADFVCPTDTTRRDYSADYLIWVDTIEKGRFDDTNKLYQPPSKFNFRDSFILFEIINLSLFSLQYEFNSRTSETSISLL
mgnify:CR=1 FL=1